MKRFGLFCLACLFAGLTAAAFPAGEADNADAPGIHAMGNGDVCVYGQGADILQVFGPPYSSPGMFTMSLLDKYGVASSREPKAAVWYHELSDGPEKVAWHTDFVTERGEAFIRQFWSGKEVRYLVELKMEERYAPYENLIRSHRDASPLKVKELNQNYRIDIAPGIPFYSDYKSPSGYHYQIFTTGAVTLTPVDRDNKKFILSAPLGGGALYVVAGRSDEELARNVRKATATSPDRQLKLAIWEWQKYSDEQKRFPGKNLARTQREEFDRATDDVGVLIRAQQGSQGAVLAGIVYHMGYVRDQYGVSRALLALGHNREARKILNFYYNVWKENGFIKNAQAIGYPGIFHRHENDEVEITGYLVVQAFDYYGRTGDAAFLKQILPMLEWATEAQRKHLIDGMLPFNGDETYIAGGILPRKVMYHGSAEATLLFIEGSHRLLDFVREKKLWPQQRIAELEKTVQDCTDRYRDNFYRDGKLYINNPARAEKAAYPDTRPGVCLYPGHHAYFPETYHYKGSLYFCKECMEKDHTGIEEPAVERFTIPSAYLFPIYINAQLFTDQEKQALLDAMVDQYRKTGRISDLDRILGYDYGMFLYALSDRNHPLATEIYAKMMGLRDSAGAWVEYYVDGKPSGCGCRPWESGINIEAAIKYAR